MLLWPSRTEAERVHEMGICSGILTAALDTAAERGATRVNGIDVTIGELTEVVEDALQFAFDVLRRQTLAEDAVLNVTFVPARSRCLECGEEFGHGRFDAKCPACGSYLVELVAGRELFVDSIDID